MTSIKVFEALVKFDKPARVTEIAEQTACSKSVVYNHLLTLKELGYVTKHNQKYSPTLKLLRFSDEILTRFETYNVGQRYVENLANTTGESVSLAVIEDTYGVVIYSSSGSDTPKPVYPLGESLPLHATAAGKAMLSLFDQNQLDTILDSVELTAETKKTITDEDAFREELQKIRDNNIAFSREEHTDKRVGVATPIEPVNETHVSAIEVTGSTDRLNDRYLEEDIPGQLQSTVRNILADLTSKTL